MRKLIPWAALLVAAGAAPRAWSQGDAKALQGEYEIVAGEDNGEKVPADHIKGSRVRITADVIATTDAQGKDIYVFKYTVNADRKPWIIAMTATGGPEGVKAGEKAYGVIKVDGDKVWLCYAPEANTPPTDFKTTAGSKANLFELKRVGK
jgi:uncharacterized protein (TIGR03067 family)